MGQKNVTGDDTAMNCTYNDCDVQIEECQLRWERHLDGMVMKPTKILTFGKMEQTKGHKIHRTSKAL
jgi:hypothetical protein